MDGPDDASADPGHALEETATVNAVFVVIVLYDIGHIVFRFKVVGFCSRAAHAAPFTDTDRPGCLDIPG